MGTNKLSLLLNLVFHDFSSPCIGQFESIRFERRERTHQAAIPHWEPPVLALSAGVETNHLSNQKRCWKQQLSNGVWGPFVNAAPFSCSLSQVSAKSGAALAGVNSHHCRTLCQHQVCQPEQLEQQKWMRNAMEKSIWCVLPRARNSILIYQPCWGHTAPRFLSFQRINRPACFSLSKNNKQSSYQTAQENGLLTTESCSVESEGVMWWRGERFLHCKGIQATWCGFQWTNLKDQWAFIIEAALLYFSWHSLILTLLTCKEMQFFNPKMLKTTSVNVKTSEIWDKWRQGQKQRRKLSILGSSSLHKSITAFWIQIQLSPFQQQIHVCTAEQIKQQIIYSHHILQTDRIFFRFNVWHLFHCTTSRPGQLKSNSFQLQKRTQTALLYLGWAAVKHFKLGASIMRAFLPPRTSSVRSQT